MLDMSLLLWMEQQGVTFPYSCYWEGTQKVMINSLCVFIWRFSILERLYLACGMMEEWRYIPLQEISSGLTCNSSTTKILSNSEQINSLDMKPGLDRWERERKTVSLLKTVSQKPWYKVVNISPLFFF